MAMTHWIWRFYYATYVLVACVSFTELCLTASLLARGNEATDSQSVKYHLLLIYFLVNAAWTTLFAVGYIVLHKLDRLHEYGIAVFMLWVFAIVGPVLSAITWAIAAGMLRAIVRGGLCDGVHIASWCHQAVVVEGLGWTVFTLCLLAILELFGICAWVVILVNLGRC